MFVPRLRRHRPEVELECPALSHGLLSSVENPDAPTQGNRRNRQRSWVQLQVHAPCFRWIRSRIRPLDRTHPVYRHCNVAHEPSGIQRAAPECSNCSIGSRSMLSSHSPQQAIRSRTAEGHATALRATRERGPYQGIEMKNDGGQDAT